MSKKNTTKINEDISLIESLGGVANLANRLGYSVQRVQNWTMRGIPSSVKLEHQEVFLSKNNSQNAV